MNKQYKNIVILTGAGISAESGLATFRSSNGLWNNHRVEDVASVEGFRRNPALVHDFYNDLKLEIQKAKPNPAHLAITRLQNEYPAEISVVTQNVDTLHEKAGNKNIYHIHGQINQAVCLNCGHILETFGDVDTETVCPQCGVVGMMKPNIVFFGENLLCMDKVEILLRSCDLFVSIGTSGVVFPAAAFVQTAKYYGADTIEFTLEPTSNNFYFDRHVYGPAGQTLPPYVDGLVKSAVRLSLPKAPAEGPSLAAFMKNHRQAFSAFRNFKTADKLVKTGFVDNQSLSIVFRAGQNTPLCRSHITFDNVKEHPLGQFGRLSICQTPVFFRPEPHIHNRIAAGTADFAAEFPHQIRHRPHILSKFGIRQITAEQIAHKLVMCQTHCRKPFCQSLCQRRLAKPHITADHMYFRHNPLLMFGFDDKQKTPPL